jgi:hypothetical protein
MHDFLRRITGFRVPPARRQFVWSDEPFIPVEFSGAAYRFGHSMVREDYRLNDQHGNVPIFPRRGMPDDLGGLRWLPARLQIDWHRFFKVSATSTQSSMRIDTSLARALTHVPPTMLALARLNLRRGRALGLPAGRDVAETLGIDPVDGDELVDRVKGHLSASERTALRRSTPLWFYILREAELRGAGGLWLGPVGSRIVSEVLTGLLEADPSSYVRQRPGWKPELPCKTPGDFTMPDLVRFTLGS